MNPRLRAAILLALAASSLSACTTVDATRRGAVAYNRAFDDARNQILLLNILRARDGYPQQFSTISTVTGSMRPEMSVTGALENIILGGAEVFKPSGTFGFRNPSVTITPLETKEFRTGMMKPITPEFVGELLAQGWTPAVVQNLTVDGMRTIASKPLGPTVPRIVTVKADEGLKMLREGAGKGYEVELVSSADDKLTVAIKKASATCVSGLPMFNDCGLHGIQAKLRSPAAMVQFLAKSLQGTPINHPPTNPYFRVINAGVRAPANTLISTHYRQQAYYIEANDRHSLETLALLAEIIGFQTTDATLGASKPALTVSQ